MEIKKVIEIEPEISIIDSKILKEKTFVKPLDFIEIPSFGSHKGIPQLLASDNYCEAIYELMEILNDPTAKSVLLIAPPGSGKEKLAEFAFHCRKNVRGNFIATTFAGLNATEVSKLLFTCSKKSLEYFNSNNTNDFTPQPEDGLLLRSLKGALFIDEIDKADRSVRDLLLRVLESGEMTDPETGRIIDISKRTPPLYIFSGSMSRKNMLQEPPPDFWTRISHVIEVSHPLAIDDIDKSKKVVKDYLWMFWSLHVKDFMSKKGLTVDTKKPLTKPLIEFNIELYSFLLNEKTIDFVCNILGDEISGRGKPLVSIRTLRSMVARSLFKLVEIIQFSKFDDEPIELYKSKNKEEFKNLTFETWFNKLFEIVSVSLYDKQKENKQIDPIELGVLESFKTAIRQGTQLVQ
ncbi:MAG: sigma 54-interacting transcriptional regulator [Bacteroidetes bacterium]|nr:sigma 54-interacting transcriptional regulator [Bacteroidota bacterium]